MNSDVSVLLTSKEIHILGALFVAILNVHGAPPDADVRAGMRSIAEKILAASEAAEAQAN